MILKIYQKPLAHCAGGLSLAIFYAITELHSDIA